MAKTKIQEYSATAASNTDVDSTNIDEGCSPAGINNAIRSVMAHIKTALSGSDDSLITGTAGADGALGAFNADGDLVAATAIDGLAIGGTTPAAGAFTTLSATGATSVAALSASGVLSVASDIQHVGDTDNKIAFGTDTQSFETGGTSRLDLSDSGVRMGATGARVTDIETTITDSDTKLPTSGAVVDYVAANGGGTDWEVVETITTTSGTTITVPSSGDLADGYEYALEFLEVQKAGGASTSLQVDVYGATAAAYTGSPLAASPSYATAGLFGWVEIGPVRTSKNAHMIPMGRLGVMATDASSDGSDAANGNTFSPIFHFATAQKINRLQFSDSGAGAFDTGAVKLWRKAI